MKGLEISEEINDSKREEILSAENKRKRDRPSLIREDLKEDHEKFIVQKWNANGKLSH